MKFELPSTDIDNKNRNDIMCQAFVSLKRLYSCAFVEVSSIQRLDR